MEAGDGAVRLAEKAAERVELLQRKRDVCVFVAIGQNTCVQTRANVLRQLRCTLLRGDGRGDVLQRKHALLSFIKSHTAKNTT